MRRTIARYGDYRSSAKPGHKHAGIDLKGSYGEPVYAIGTGQVIEVFRSFPHRSIVVEHRLPDSSSIYSVYTHVAAVDVAVGDRVTEDSNLARIFTKEELGKADFGTPPHLHLEIRRSFEDRGSASWRSMTMEALNEYCRDPLEFFGRHLAPGP